MIKRLRCPVAPPRSYFCCPVFHSTLSINTAKTPASTPVERSHTNTSNTTMEEPCPICLEPFFTAKVPEVTRLQPCSHFYHPECIHLWRERSNQCPTCRRDYVLMEAVSHAGQVLKSEVADRVELPPAEDEFFDAPLEDTDIFIAPTEYARLALRIDRQVARSNRCTLCDSNRGQVLSCNECSSTFHGQCLGLGQERVAQWLCPMCSAEQGTYQPPSLFRRSRNSERTNRVYNTLMASSRTRNMVLSEHAMTDLVVERPQISPEEAFAWDSFEMARKEEETEGQASSSLPSLRQIMPQPQYSPETQRKQKLPSRRSRRQPNESSSSSTSDLSTMKTSSTTAGPSLINSLLEQMKDYRPTERIPAQPPRVYEPLTMRYHGQSSTSMSSESSSPMEMSLPTSPESPSSPTDITKKSFWKMTVENNTLSFTQKNILQETVRKKLRPMYKDGVLTEEQYTQVNMKVSRILYDVCLKDSESNPDFEQLAQWYVDQEINQLRVAL